MRTLTIFLMVVIIGLIAGTAFAQVGVIRVMSYNVLNYSTNTGPARNPDFSIVVNDIEPDIILAQEMLGSSAADLFVNSVLDPADWAHSPTTNGTNEEFAFYRTDRFELLSVTSISTALRDIELFEFRSIDLPGQPTIMMSTAHLKASQGYEANRLAEVQQFINYMNANDLHETDLLFTGDLNVYTSAEPAYQALLGDGGFEDPISTPGTWHNGPAYADIHTQSPRTQQFGGGANGGMDDRFDFILALEPLFDGLGWDIIPDTYTAFGNDGNHYNTAINDGFNSAVSATVANALHDATDHLPVFVDVGYWLEAGADILLSLESTVENPTIFPAGGGIEYTAYVTNTTDNLITTQAWTEAILPNGNTYGPILQLPNFNLPANNTIVRTLILDVPAAAPGGSYSYVAKIGTYPNDVTVSDSFPFTKLGGTGNIIAFLDELGIGSDDALIASGSTLPSEFELARVYPNPFNSQSTVEISLPEAQHLTVAVYDVTGRLVSTVADGTYEAGNHHLNLDLRKQASGMYFVTAQSNGVVRTAKAMLVR
jgi:Secretion system C-terminal sorting domain